MSSKVPLSFSTSEAGGAICDRLTKHNAGWASQSLMDIMSPGSGKPVKLSQPDGLRKPKYKLPGQILDEIICEQERLGVIPFPADVRKHSTNRGPRSYFCGKRKRHFTYHTSLNAMAVLQRQHREFTRT